MNEELNQLTAEKNYSNTEDSENRPIWAAMLCFILSIMNLLMCCCCTYATVPISLALGGLSLVRKWRGKGFAISGIIISAVTIVFVLIGNVMLKEESDDIMKIYSDPAKYIQMYEETGEVPEEFQKYGDEKYDAYWSYMGCKDFDEFYVRFLESIGSMTGNKLNTDKAGSDDKDSEESTEPTTRPSNYGEEPVKI